MNRVQKFLAEKVFGIRSVDLSGANNIFGTLGAGAFPLATYGKDFIPKDDGGGIINLGGLTDGGSAKWIGLGSKQMQFWAYAFCTPLAAVIDRLAQADTNGILQFVDEDTNVPIKNVNKIPRLSRIKALLKKPNPWQTWEEFEGEQVVLCKIFGYCPVFSVGPKGFDKSYTKALINLNPVYLTPQRNNEFSIYKSEGKIKSWTLNVLGNTYDIPSEDIMLIKDGFVTKTTDDLDLPMSKINGLDFAVSNFCASMEADNVILKKKGPLGVFSFDPGKDMAGTTPLDPEAKDALQEDLLQYGLTIGQIQYVVSKMPVKWSPISFNLRDLMTKEVSRAAMDLMCDRFDYPAELMSGKNATYENRNTSEKFLYQNNIIPYSLRRMTRYNNFFDLTSGVIIRKSYSHLPVLQEDIVKAGEAYLAESQGLDVDWKSGMITWNQWQIRKERDPVPGMDIYYPEYIKKFPSMDLNKQKDVKTPTPKDTGTKK